MSTEKTSAERGKKAKKKPRYGKAANEAVRLALHEAKRGQLRSGRSKKKVRSRKQAIAIGLSQARKRGAKVPPPESKKRSRKKASS